METIYKAPDWLHRPANINTAKLQTIQLELLQVAKKVIHDIDNSPSQFINIDDLDMIKSLCPILMSELDRLGLTDLFFMISLITLREGSYFPIHVDYPDPIRLSFGLNIPVLNCKDSYTIWYDAKVLPHLYLPSYIMTSALVSTAMPCDETTAIELDRIECSTPSWVNNHIPHKPHCNHNKFRINASLRFTNHIYEMIDNGYFEQHLVKHD